MNKIAFFLLPAMLLLGACGDDSSSGWEENQAPVIVPLSDGTEDSSESGNTEESSSSGKSDSSAKSSDSAKSSGKTESSSSNAGSKWKETLSANDTLLYVDKICLDDLDSVHYLYANFRSDVQPTGNVYAEMHYGFIGGSGSGTIYSVITNRIFLADSLNENGWYSVRFTLEEMDRYRKNNISNTSVETFVLYFTKNEVDKINYVKVPVNKAIALDGCIQVDKLFTINDSSAITRYNITDYLDSAHKAMADTFPTIDSLKKRGCYGTDHNCKPRQTHYVSEIDGYVYCLSGTCYRENEPEIELEDLPMEGSFTDPRDGTVYPTVTIGMNEFFAKSLNYVDSVKYPNLAGHTWCYNNDKMYCDKFGRLYDWSGALDLPDAYNDSAIKNFEWYQGICPEGWHVPTADEFSSLWLFSGRLCGTYDWRYTTRDIAIWDSLQSTEYNNITGFSALPGGYRSDKGEYKAVGYEVRFLLTGTHNSVIKDNAYAVIIYRNSKDDDYNNTSQLKRTGAYVRCVRGKGIVDARPYMQKN